MRGLKILLEAFNNTTFYLLGAGASAGIVPMTSQLKDPISEDQMKLGSYNGEPIPQDIFTHRIIGDISKEDFFLCRISPDFVLANAIHQLSKHHCQKIEYCPQYDVFTFAKKLSTIFTANLDGLAERHKHDHYVYHFHGVIPKYFGSNEFSVFIQDHFSFYDSLSIEIGNILLIQKEASDIIYKTPYRLAKNAYTRSKYLVIIGYSFGKNPLGFDDDQTYKYIFEKLYRTNKIPILIISPDTYELKYQIQETVKSKEVYALNMYWDCLSKALINHYIEGNCHNGRSIFRILDRYHFWEDLK